MARLRPGTLLASAFAACALATSSSAFVTSEPSQVIGDAPANGSFDAIPLFTVGETVFGYRAPGILDGIGAMQKNFTTMRILVNHELTADTGYQYSLANGLSLRGARVSYFDVHRATRQITGAGLAYDTIYDRAGVVVTQATQINEGSGSNILIDGFDRFCSSSLFTKNSYGLVDDIYFCGEETGSGQECALDVQNGDIWVVPQLGRQAWENVTLVHHPDPSKVAILTGDDIQAAPLWLYIGTKNALGNGSFLDRNGLASGVLYVWKTDNGDLTPQQFNGTGSSRTGSFVALENYRPDLAGTPGWDSLGYATEANIDAQSIAANAFRFSRPEDVATNPHNALQVAFASTGRGSLYPADNWGDTNIIEMDYSLGYPTATVTILYDGDDSGAGQFTHPDYGLRNPDNLDWGSDGFIYVNEDRSTQPASIFGSVSGIEASMWKVDPASGILSRIGVIDRTAVPSGQSDPVPADLGNWETSGVLDISSLMVRRPGERVLVLDTQAHSLVGPPLGAPNQSQDLVEGGQLLLFSSRGLSLDELFVDDETKLGVAESPADAFRVTRNAMGGTSASFEFSLDRESHASTRIYDVTGRMVRTIVDGVVPAGTSVVDWNGRDESGALVPSGVYFARFEAEGLQKDAKVVVVR